MITCNNKITLKNEWVNHLKSASTANQRPWFLRIACLEAATTKGRRLCSSGKLQYSLPAKLQNFGSLWKNLWIDLIERMITLITDVSNGLARWTSVARRWQFAILLGVNKATGQIVERETKKNNKKNNKEEATQEKGWRTARTTTNKNNAYHKSRETITTKAYLLAFQATKVVQQ